MRIGARHVVPSNRLPLSPVHRVLREATADAHTDLDALFAQFDLGDATDYARFLSAHAAALMPVEEWLDTHGADRVAADWPARRRGQAIAADLAELDAAPPEPLRFDPPAPDGAVAGVLYVIEGSRLGGRVLARQVAAGLPRRYLDPLDGRPSWPALLAAIDAALPERPAQAAAVAAARATFALFAAAGTRQLGA